MKTINDCLRYALVSSLGLASAFAHADDTLINANNQVGIGVGVEQLRYHEWNDQKYPLDSERGTLNEMYSIFASTQSTWFGVSDMYASFSYDYAKGHTRYNGYLQNEDTGELTPATARTPNRITDFDLKVGRAFSVSQTEDTQLIPYVDLARHSWNRLATNADDYSEYYRNDSASLGVLGQHAFGQALVVGVYVQAGSTIDPTLHASDQAGHFDLGSKFALGAGFNADYALTRQFHVSASYKWDHFRYGVASLGNYTEPNSATSQHRVQLSASYAF